MKINKQAQDMWMFHKFHLFFILNVSSFIIQIELSLFKAQKLA